MVHIPKDPPRISELTGLCRRKIEPWQKSSGETIYCSRHGNLHVADVVNWSIMPLIGKTSVIDDTLTEGLLRLKRAITITYWAWSTDMV
jgi:hypothetical protein